MILHELKALALREGLVDDPAFESKPVRWVIVLDEDGGYKSLRDTLQDVPLKEGQKGKPKQQAAMFAIPRRNGRRAVAAADFLVDKSEYVLGIEPDEKRSKEDLESRRLLFVALLHEANHAVESQLLQSVIAFLQDDEARRECADELIDREYASNDLITFRVGNDLLHEVEAIRRWWDQRAVPTRKVNADSRQCLLCGLDSAPVEKHDSLQIAGGVAAGVALVTFNSSAFEKYGLERNDNAPICRACMTAYVEGLRRLINTRYVSARTGESLTPQSVRLSGDTTAAFWANIPDELVGTLSDLMYAPQKVRDLLDSPHRGQRSSGAAERFFCLILSGAQGRAMLRGMHTGTLAELETNLGVFFDAIRLEGDRGEPKPLGFLLRSLVLQGKLDRLPPRLAGEVFLGVLFGTGLPRLVLAAAVQRNRAEQKVTPERAALLQLYFASHHRKKTASHYRKKPANYDQRKEVSKLSLDTETTDTPYRLGRLLSAYEQLQYSAHQTRSPGSKLNRSLVDRYFGAASTRPGVVFAQLARLSQSHIGLLRRYGRTPDKNIAEICEGFDGIGFPSMLTLEEQGRFALGYYHQRQSFFRSAKPSDPTPEDTSPTPEGDTTA